MNVFFTTDIRGSYAFLDEPESKHCIRVLRHSKSDGIVLVDGDGGFYKAIITDPDPRKCKVEIVSHTTCFEARNNWLHIAIAPTKNIDRFEWFVEKSIEVGIDVITPLICDHSERKNLKSERIEKVIVSAMKQSLKAYKPVLNKITTFDAFISCSFPGDKFIAHLREGQLYFLGGQVKKNGKTTILIGPEGDFSEREVCASLENGFKEVSLGRSRLRTETAGIVACTIVNMVNEL